MREIIKMKINTKTKKIRINCRPQISQNGPCNKKLLALIRNHFSKDQQNNEIKSLKRQGLLNSLKITKKLFVRLIFNGLIIKYRF